MSLITGSTRLQFCLGQGLGGQPVGGIWSVELDAQGACGQLGLK